MYKEFINLCEASNIAILGFDGYKPSDKDEGIELNLNSIADFSDLKKSHPSFSDYQKQSILSARKLFESDFGEESEDVGYGFVLDFNDG